MCLWKESLNFRISGKTADGSFGGALVYQSTSLIESSKSSLSDLVGLMAHRYSRLKLSFWRSRMFLSRKMSTISTSVQKTIVLWWSFALNLSTHTCSLHAHLGVAENITHYAARLSLEPLRRSTPGGSKSSSLWNQVPASGTTLVF